MTVIEKDRLLVKVFIGLLLNSELRIQLNKSISWKQEQIGSSENSLKEIRFNSKEYLGYYISQELIQIELLKKLECDIRKNINTFCPYFPIDRIPVHIFPQIFIE